MSQPIEALQGSGAAVPDRFRTRRYTVSRLEPVAPIRPVTLVIVLLALGSGDIGWGIPHMATASASPSHTIAPRPSAVGPINSDMIDSAATMDTTPTSAVAALQSYASSVRARTRSARSSRPSGVARSDHHGAAPAAAARAAPTIHSHTPLLLERAYSLLQANRLEEATAAYHLALGQDPRNPDALAGLAALTAHGGDATGAERLYARALEADPQHAAALAGLMGIAGSQALGGPAGAESLLKAMLANAPDNSTLHFALGNLMASQGRWNEAQEAYFHAHAATPDNPDTAYNLAVALDHLHQPHLAARHYQLALLTAQRRPAGFDQAQARSRLQQLAPTP